VPVPIIVPRAEHRISRRDIDPDALKVLYRLHEHKYTAYLVGGSVRDLLLGRRPKDFDIGTDAHPYQIKKLFRNCWIIGRRFRLAHVKFGLKTIEVATFRRVVPEPVEAAPGSEEADPPVVVASAPAPPEPPAADHGLLHRDNTFGTPEEDAFRRDLTINGLFYDIATFSVIDYVGGLADLEACVVRSIGDPRVRFVEDPVRMLRAVVMATRLGFDMDPPVVEAIAEHRGLLAQASPARLLEEYYKILRSGYAEATFRALNRERLLELMTPELKTPPKVLWDWLAALDRYRLRFPSAPPELTNTILIGALLVPTGVLDRPAPPRTGQAARRDDLGDRVSFGVLPVARKDLERLRAIQQMLPRMADPVLPPRVARGLVHRPAFADALIWLEIYGDAPDVIERWKEAAQVDRTGEDGDAATPPGETEAPRRRRRRRRRGRRGGRDGSGQTGGHGPGGGASGGGA
jgi:poly(A) polymerase